MIPQHKKPLILVNCIFAVLVCGICFLSWKDIYAEAPKFDQLQEARANGFHAKIEAEVWGVHDYSIEFYDSLGKRFQARGVDKSAVDLIRAALPTEVPVLIRYGRWRSVFPSTKIFTIYQVEVGKQVVVPYSRLANAIQREQSGGPWIILCTILMACGAVFFVTRRQMKFQRQLAALKSNDSD